MSELLKISFIRFFYLRSYRKGGYYSSFEITYGFKIKGDVFVVALIYFEAVLKTTIIFEMK